MPVNYVTIRQPDSSIPQNEDVRRLLNATVDAQSKMSLYQHVANIVTLFNQASNDTGGYVRLAVEYSFCPVLIGNDNTPVPLYELIEVIDESIDYEQLLEDFPNLSYSQIDGAISFLRKIAQFNAKGVNIDDIIDETILSDRNFVSVLSNSYPSKENNCVLNFD